VVTLLIVIPAAQFLKRDPSQIGLFPYGSASVKPNDSVTEVSGVSIKQAIGTRQFWILAAIYLCFGFQLSTAMVHFVPHVTDLGFTAIMAATMLSIRSLIGLPSRFIVGIAADKIGSKRMLVIVFLLLSTGFTLILVSNELWALYLFAILSGFTGMAFVLQTLLIAEQFGLLSHGVILGSIALMQSIGSTTSPTLSGYLFDITSSYQVAFLISVVLGITALCLTFLLRLVHSD
jgi:MFS family permease